MKTNFLKLSFMALMMLMAGISFTACGDDEDDTNTGEVIPGDDEQPAIESITANYSVRAGNMDNLLAVADEVYVRYVGEDNTIHQEAFTGEWSKTIRINAVDGKCSAALQIIGVAKDDAELDAIPDQLDIDVDMDGNTYVATFTSGESTEATASPRRVLPSVLTNEQKDTWMKNIRLSGERYGGVVFSSYAISYDGISVSTASTLWEDNKFVPGE